MSDVPLGVFLSGGIDSSALAAMVARATREPLQTFAVGFAEREANELPYARLVASHIGAEHREVVVTPDPSSSRRCRSWCGTKTSRSRFPSSVPLYFVAAAGARAREGGPDR